MKSTLIRIFANMMLATCSLGSLRCHNVVSGKLRYRFPVSLASALTTAGEMTGTGGSPQPVGASVLGTMCTSTATGESTMYGGA